MTEDRHLKAAYVSSDPDTQLALLDRIASTGAAVARYGRRLEELRGLAQQLVAIDALGTEEQREQLQTLVDQVCRWQLRRLTILHETPFPTRQRSCLTGLLRSPAERSMSMHGIEKAVAPL